MGAIFRNWHQARHLGFPFLLRHRSRLTGRPISRVKVKNFGDVFLRCGQSDVDATLQTLAYRQYQLAQPLRQRVQDRYNKILKIGTPVIVDAGANIGMASLWFAREYPQAKVIAIEPEPGNFAVLEKNASLNPRIKPVHAAVGSSGGFVSVHAYANHGWSATTKRSEDGVPLMMMAEAFVGGIPFIAKIDIEGFESDLFASSTQWLAKIHLLFVEPHDWLFPGKKTSLAFQKAVSAHDFEIHLSGENLIYFRA